MPFDPSTAQPIAQFDPSTAKPVEGAAPPPTPEESFGDALRHYAKGIEQGFYRIPQSIAELGAKAADATGITTGAEQNIRKFVQEGNALAEPDQNNKYVKTGDVVGRMIATAPVLGLKAVGGAGLLANTADAALQGGTAAALTSSASDEPVGEQIAGGAALGGIAGGAFGLGKTAYNVGKAFIAGKTASPADQAASLILKALQQDKVSPVNASQALAQFADKPAALMDVGGSNTARLARTVATLPGQGSEDLTKFLAERQADQNGRVLTDISTNLANGSDVHAIGQKLIDEQQTTASPLYDAAYKANPSMASPMIDKVLDTEAGKKALGQARTLMSNDMRLMGVPDKELLDQAIEGGTSVPKSGVASGLRMETLDYVKKGLDDQISSALSAGNKRSAGVIIGLKNKLLNAMDAADSTLSTGPNSTNPAGGLYKQARAAFAGPAQSLEAIENGKSFLDLSPEELKDTVAKLPAGNRNLYKVGAARALQDRINSVADNRDAVARVFGNKTIRQQIDAVFGGGATQKFSRQMTTENMLSGTNRFVTGGSNTANKMADVANAGGKVGEDVVKGFAAGGPHGAVALPAMNFAKAKANAFFNGMSPEVRNHLADLLMEHDGAALNVLGKNLTPGTLNNRGVNALSLGAVTGARALSQSRKDAN